MSLLTGITNFFGLDIGTSGIRLVELKGSGPAKALTNYALVPVDSKLILSDAKTDQQKIAVIIKQLVGQAKPTTKNVAVSLPSSRVFTTIVDMDKLSNDELSKSIQFQADTLIPTPLENSKIDWSLLGQSPIDANKVEVLLSSVPNDFIVNLLDMLEGIGLNVIALEPEAVALARAVLPAGNTKPQIVLDIGATSSDLIIVMNGGPRLIRSIPVGTELLIRTVSENLSIDQKQAEQFIYKFGMSKDKVEGQIYRALSGASENLFQEIEKSIKFFQNRYRNVPIEKIYVTGGAAVIPEFPLFIANKYGLNVEIGNAWTNVSIPANKKNELMAVSSFFSVAAGLAERNI
jgi:type IV pilus assembly protein PilM